jgi:hypothetical protein
MYDFSGIQNIPEERCPRFLLDRQAGQVYMVNTLMAWSLISEATPECGHSL